MKVLERSSDCAYEILQRLLPKLGMENQHAAILNRMKRSAATSRSEEFEVAAGRRALRPGCAA
jgi:hypothetical protein